MPSNNNRKNRKKKKTATRSRKKVNVIPTLPSQSLIHRRKELEAKKSTKSKSKSNKRYKPHRESNDHNHNVKKNETDDDDDDNEYELNNDNDSIQSVDINENDKLIDEIFDDLTNENKITEDDFNVLEDIGIDPDELVYILNNSLSECISVLGALTGGKWNGTQIMQMKMKYDMKCNKAKVKENNINKNITPTKKNIRDESESESDTELEFELEWDTEKPNYKQFMVFYDDPNKYQRIKLLGRVYHPKRYLYFVELIYLCIDFKKNNNNNNKNKKKKKIYGKDVYSKKVTTFWLRKLHWFYILFALKDYVSLTADPKTFSRKQIQPRLESGLVKIYQKNKAKNKIKNYKFSFKKPFVNDCFAAIGDGWKFIKEVCEKQSENDNDSEPKRRGRKKKNIS